MSVLAGGRRGPDLARDRTRLVDGGMSQRQAAKVFGVDQKTISNDVRNFSSKNEESVLTGSAETKARRAAVAAQRRLTGVVQQHLSRFVNHCPVPLPYRNGAT
jgi:transposase